jgi:hypothetical protein
MDVLRLGDDAWCAFGLRLSIHNVQAPAGGPRGFDYNGGSIAYHRPGSPLMTPSPIVAALLVPFIMWRVYQRIKRLMVRQRSQPWRHRVAVILFPVLMVLLGVNALANPLALAGMAAGIAAGAALGVLGLRRTTYERIGGACFYTPDAHIGVLVSMLFLGRLLYRGYEFYMLAPAQQQDFSSSPLTLMVFGVLAGYYTMYAAGLLRWRKTQTN